VVTPGILKCITGLSKKYGFKIFGDSQSSSQIGNILKFQDFDLLTPTEKEARIALGDKYSGLEALGTNLIKQTKSKNVLVKLNADGFIAFHKTENKLFLKTQHFPALNPHPVDVVGAGDSLLTGTAVSMCAGADLFESSAIGAVTAAIAVGKMGNIPVTAEEIRNYFREKLVMK
jgi:sugar/nucleoside kinase (ribokinase family)